MSHELVTYRRSELYAEVWREPVCTVARRYGVSDVALGKICRRLGIPLPGVGYWAKKAAGYDVKRLRLPRAKDGLEELTVNRWRSDTPRETKAIRRRTAAEIAEARARMIPVPDALVEPHKLVAQAHDRLFNRKPGSSGLVRCTTFRCLDLCVTPASLDRALRLMDALLKACEQRQLTFEVTPLAPKEEPGARHNEPTQPPNVTRVQVDGEWISLSMVERCNVERDPMPTPPKNLEPGYHTNCWVRDNRPELRYVPNGLLELEAISAEISAKWRDRKRTKLESRLHEVVAHLPVIATQVKQARAEAERRRREFEEEQERRREAARRQWEEQQLTDQNLEKLKRWRLARDVREFAEEARRIVLDGEFAIRPEGWVNELSTWAQRYADKIDPLTFVRTEIAQRVADRAATDEGKLRAEAEHQAREEAQRAVALADAIGDWRRAQDIREYVAAMTAAVVDNECVIDTDSDFTRSTEWSLLHADRIDPVGTTREVAIREAAKGANTENTRLSILPESK